MKTLAEIERELMLEVGDEVPEVGRRPWYMKWISLYLASFTRYATMPRWS